MIEDADFRGDITSAPHLKVAKDERISSNIGENLIKEIPLKYIASYIGVTPQALSRIRKRIS